jgi:Transposase DDE domain
LSLFSDMARSASRTTGYQKTIRHLLAHTLCQGKHTVTQLLRTAGQQHSDWSADYRLYSSQLRACALFEPIIKGVEGLLDEQQPLVLAVDDSMMGKTGHKIPGSGWHRDSQSPPFHTNLKYSLRFVQLSAAVHPFDHPECSRLIPVAFELIPKLPKLPPEPDPEERARYQANSPGMHALHLLKSVRQQLGPERPIYLTGDGGYTNTNFLRGIPERVVYFGRCRGDMNLRAIPDPCPSHGKGRPLAYGRKLPTPEELRNDEQVSWQACILNKRGKQTTFRFKHIPQARSRITGEKAIIQVVVIAGLRYKKRKDASWSYTRPAYVMCTDPSLDPRKVIEVYSMRWGIEVNFKEEKQLFGIGHPQVRHPQSVTAAPTLAVAAYAALHLAAIRAFGYRKLPPAVSLPKWRKRKPPRRLATLDLITQLQHETNVHYLNFSGFASATSPNRTLRKAALAV